MADSCIGNPRALSRIAGGCLLTGCFVLNLGALISSDVAGPVWSDKGKGVNPAGATGYGVRTLVNWVLAQS